METLATARLKYPPLVTKPTPFLAVPMYGDVPAEFHASMMSVARNRELFADECQSSYHGDSLVMRARNELTRQFLESGCSHMFFIDSDLIFSAEHIKRILDHNEDIVGGAYSIKDQRAGQLKFVWNTHFEPRQPDARGLVDCRYVGTGFMCIKREVFEKMMESGLAKPFKHDEADRTDYDFWQAGTYTYTEKDVAIPKDRWGTNRYLSEDWWFCQNALNLGFKVWFDGMCVIRHVGKAIWPLEFQTERLGFSNEQVFRDAETGGADSLAKSPVLASRPPAPIGVEDD